MATDWQTFATAGATVTVAAADAWPPDPLQVSVYVALATRPPVEAVPLTALLPDHGPVAVQAVAFVLLHRNVLAVPVVTVVGDADSETVGAAGPRFPRAAELLGATAPIQTADSANTTISLRCATANTPERA